MWSIRSKDLSKEWLSSTTQQNPAALSLPMVEHHRRLWCIPLQMPRGREGCRVSPGIEFEILTPSLCLPDLEASNTAGNRSPLASRFDLLSAAMEPGVGGRPLRTNYCFLEVNRYVPSGVGLRFAALAVTAAIVATPPMTTMAMPTLRGSGKRKSSQSTHCSSYQPPSMRWLRIP